MSVWCFIHEEMIELETGKCTGHTFIAYEDQEIGLSNLEFHCLTEDDFAYCPPPPALFSVRLGGLDESEWEMYFEDYEWEKWCEDNEPSSSELFVMNCHARELESTW